MNRCKWLSSLTQLILQVAILSLFLRWEASMNTKYETAGCPVIAAVLRDTIKEAACILNYIVNSFGKKRLKFIARKQEPTSNRTVLLPS
jgi:hypothetical protein